ncbi:hypothetical protein, partial [Hydrogenophaga sp. 5NK40-0174]|uniref:hypothetical protein n=1 Tax=Hydrogenophaga sp. 5NK40-0174 TaxID=3127649 RepID=UPI00333FE85E
MKHLLFGEAQRRMRRDDPVLDDSVVITERKTPLWMRAIAALLIVTTQVTAFAQYGVSVNNASGR